MTDTKSQGATMNNESLRDAITNICFEYGEANVNIVNKLEKLFNKQLDTLEAELVPTNKDLQEMIEDWLDNDHHSGRLTISMGFKDIQTVARLLTPRITEPAHTAIRTFREGLNK